MSKKIIERQQMLEVIREVQDMLEADDGKPFEIKKEEIISMLDEKLAAYEQERKENRKRMIAQMCRGGSFWEYGDAVYSDERIILRRVNETDREKFMELQKENTIMPAMYEDESFSEDLWIEHLVETALMCSIFNATDGEYVGYCGIKNINAKRWEIAIEILEVWKRKGIGFLALSKLLDAVARHCGVTEFRVRIQTDNYPSQALFEKLGAIPNGISEFLIHDEETIRECEEANLDCIDEQMEALAEKFGVEARSLLSHVLEYRLVWNDKRHEGGDKT